MDQKLDQILPKIGYLYHYPRIDHPTDTFRLDIHLTSKPTNQHFDILRVRFSVKTVDENIKLLKVTHPWIHEKSIEISPGKVIMEDRKGKKEEAFTFGGHLTIDNLNEQTFGVLVSSAPILEVTGAIPLHLQFVNEVEILLAERQAKYKNVQEYEKQLIKTDPSGLYLACLESLLIKYERLHKKAETHYQFLAYLHSQKHRMEVAGLVNKPILNVDELFKAN